MSEIAIWPNQNKSNAIQQVGDLAVADRSVQILNGALEQCKQRISTVDNQGGDAIRRSGDFVDEGDRGPIQTQLYEFCKKVWRIRNYTNGEIQHIGSRASRGILEKVRSRRDKFANEVGAQLDLLGMSKEG